jgi:hypothetical protein
MQDENPMQTIIHIVLNVISFFMILFYLLRINFRLTKVGWLKPESITHFKEKLTLFTDR